MTDFAECSMAMQDFLMILLETCLILELILLLIRITCFYRKKKIITAVTVFAVSFMLMGFLMNDHRYYQGGKRISANAPGVSGQCFDGSDGGIVALSLLGNLERETQISPFSVLLVCE